MQDLADQFARLPGIGGKTAQRLAFYVLSLPEADAQSFADAIIAAKKEVHTCPVCQNLTDREICPICSAPARDQGLICVVAEPKDVIAMERSREFTGVYHVLHGNLSPMQGRGPQDIKIRELVARMNENVKEVILATNPNVEGEATAMYIARLLKPTGIKISRIAHGIPVGGDLEYADEITLTKAMEGRREM